MIPNKRNGQYIRKITWSWALRNKAHQRQLRAADKNEAVNAPVSPANKIDEALVTLSVEQYNAQANIKSIQSADEALGTLIDIKTW